MCANRVHGLSLSASSTGNATGNSIEFINQQVLPLAFGVAKGSEWLPAEVIDSLTTYRSAVRCCWENRRIRGMTRAHLAELVGLYASHVSDYLSESNEGHRNLPAEHIASFEAVCGNRAITQFEMKQRGLHIMEQMISKEAA